MVYWTAINRFEATLKAFLQLNENVTFLFITVLYFEPSQEKSVS